MTAIKRVFVHFCLYIPYFIYGQDYALGFKHLSLENGLSQSSVSCVLMDSNGYMWFGTEDGLNKYDGNDFTVYRHNPNDQQSLSSSYINTIIEQQDGHLWIGTKNGLNYFNPVKENFTRFLHYPKDTLSLSSNEINALLLNSKKQLIVGTGDGLNKYLGEKKFIRYNSDLKNTSYNIIAMSKDTDDNLWILSPQMLEKIKLENEGSKVLFRKQLKNSYKYSMLIDSLNLWIGTSNGLVKYNIQTESSESYKFYSQTGVKDKRNNVLSIINNYDNGLYLGTLEGGLINFNKETEEFSTIRYDPNNSSGLNSNSIKSLFIDESDLLWIGTYGRGINKYDPNQFKFEHYSYSPNTENGLSESTIRAVLKDKDDELWIGTHDGLNRFNRATNIITVYKHDQFKNSTISSNTVRALKEDSKGIIWAGTWADGLNSFSKKTNVFTRYISLPNSADTIGPVQALAIDKQDNVWVGGRGLRRFNQKTGTHKTYFYSKNNDSGSYGIYSLYFDSKESLWVGTQKNGLLKLDVTSGDIKHFTHNVENPLSISHNHITSIAEDRKGDIWVGTYGGGLNKLETSTGDFSHYNTNNGLLNDVIYGVLVDKKGDVWFASNEGLSKLNPKTNQLIHYDTEHGIQSKEFNAGAYHNSKDGELFFGGINGLNAFYPNTLENNNSVSKIVFTNFHLLDKERVFTANQLFGKSISSLQHITLKYFQNNFALKFSELNYSNNVNNTYEYQLKGLSNNWHSLNKERLITLGNLKPGDYNITVRAQNQINKYASLSFTILKPYWKTNWAYIIYIVLFFTILFLVYRNIKNNLALKKQFELKIKHLEQDIITSTHNQNKNRIDYLTSGTANELSVDEKFLHRATEIVEEHIIESNFDVQKFADEMFLSKSQLYRKLKRTTGCSTTEFIRLIRLKKAAQLLKANSATISEIAYKVGFDNVGYFSKCFKELFGTPPSQYK